MRVAVQVGKLHQRHTVWWLNMPFITPLCRHVRKSLMQTCWDQKVASFPCRLSPCSEPENEANQKVFALLKCEFKIAVKQWNGLGMRLLHKFIIVV